MIRFFGLVEPLRLGAYREGKTITQDTPLTALGDIAVADSPAVRHFAELVDSFLNEAAQSGEFQGDYGDELIKEFHSWGVLKPSFHALGSVIPGFRDGESTATDLSDLGAAGEEAVAFLRYRVSPPPGWMERQWLLLSRARTPKGLLRVAVVDSMQQLITAVDNLSRLSEPKP